MKTPTLRTIARPLAPWRVICKLWAINRKLQRSNDRLSEMVFLACSKNVAKDRRLRHCPTHGQQPPNAWGCPECVRELRTELAEARQEVEYLRRDLDTAREAVRRLVRWNLEAYDSEVTRGVYLWATLNGMAGPLLPMPEWLAKREQQQGDPEARC
jgi:hypothetical protein